MEKSNVVKSKSSNSAITTKSDNHSSNKKSRSSAEFQRNVVKKRGVYVEKKATNVSIRNQGNLRDQAVSPPRAPPRAPPRPKPGQKRFLTSVLTILSKSTAATQFPENEAKPPRKSRAKRKSDGVESGRHGNKTKSRYRSKVLSDKMFENFDPQKSLVIQYKNINTSPSNHSESDSYRHPEFSTKVSNFVRSDKGSVMSSEAKGVVKQVLEGLNMKKDLIIKEPVTQMEKINNKNHGENDEHLYKFFVDLLETTFSVYNVKAEYDAAPNESAASSKVRFEIDEAVVKKLDTRKSHCCKDDEDCTKPKSYCVKDTDISGGKNLTLQPCCKRTKDVPMKFTKPKRRLMTQSFTYSKKPIKNATDANNAFLFREKRFSKKAKKENLINLFKEQLKITYSDYEEPQTLYQALKVMAKNKRKCQKATRFDVPTTHECVFRRPKIISSKKPKRSMKYDYDDYCPLKRCESIKSKCNVNSDMIKPTEKYSHHTLEVYGYDYEDNLKPSMSVDQEVLLRHRSDTSDEEFSFDNFDTFDKYRDQIDMFGELGR